jgi:hypothetical protein
MRTYAPDAQYIRHPSGEVVRRGIDQIRRNFGDVFAGSPNAHAHIAARIALGAFVVDDERVTGRSGLPDARILVLYEVRDDLIQNVWTIRG